MQAACHYCKMQKRSNSGFGVAAAFVGLNLQTSQFGVRGQFRASAFGKMWEQA